MLVCSLFVAVLGFEAVDLEKDFDADEYERQMNATFGDDFYAVEETEKPVFDDDGLDEMGDYEGENDQEAAVQTAEDEPAEEDNKNRKKKKKKNKGETVMEVSHCISGCLLLTLEIGRGL